MRTEKERSLPCLRAWLQRHGRALGEQHPLVPSNLDFGFWLYVAERREDVFRLGCKVCTLAKCDSVFGAGGLTKHHQIKGDKLKKHEAALVHKRAVALLLGLDEQAALEAEVRKLHPPPASDFRRVWDARLKVGPTPTLEGVGERWKIQRMEHCIYEALCMEERLDLREASCLATHTDGRKHHLTICFVVNNDDIAPRRGLLGHSNYIAHKTACQESTLAMKAAFDEVIRDFCIFGRHDPRGARIQSLDSDLYDNFRAIHEVFDTDGEKVLKLGLDLAGALLAPGEDGAQA